MRHHYLSRAHNNGANVYVATINGYLAAFISVMHFPHAIVKNMKKVHRLVVLPDFQGFGIGGRLLDAMGEHLAVTSQRLSIVTSSPALAFGLRNNPKWVCPRFGRAPKNTSGQLSLTTSCHRITTNWEYKD